MFLSVFAMPLLLSLRIVLRNRTAVQAFSATVTRRTPLARRMDGFRWLATLSDDIGTAADPSGTIVSAVKLGEAQDVAVAKSPRRTKRGFKQRKTHQHTVPVDPNLDWERFEFSESPKWDRRFDADTILTSQDHSATSTFATDGNNSNNDATVVFSKEEALEKLVQTEAAHDVEYTHSLQHRQAMWDQLDPAVVQRAIETIAPCINPDRVAKIQRVLSQRTRHTRFLFEST
jgi:hypothetical protein